jgi:hypothetical protein
MNKKIIKIPLDKDSRIIVAFQRERNEICNFIVVLETKLTNIGYKTEEWVQVLRFDNAHGYPHMDKLDKDGNKVEIIKFDYLTNKEALTISIELIKNNYKEFVKSFLQNDGN